MSSLAQVTNTPKELTDKEKEFLRVLFTEARGDLQTAKKIAGYGRTVPVSKIVSRLKEEIVEECKLYLATAAPQALVALQEIVQSEMPVPDARNRIAAAKEILDRAGYVKPDNNAKNRTEDASRVIVMLPPKNNSEETKS